MKKILSLILALAFQLQAQDIQTVAEGNNSFGFNLYEQVKSEENKCFSPYCISSAFAMTYLGSAGSTKAELAHLFDFPLVQKEAAKSWQALSEFLVSDNSKNIEKKLKVQSANSLWLQNDFALLNTYTKLLNNYHEAKLHLVDYKQNADEAILNINEWVKEQTFGKIQDLLSKATVNSDTRLVLVSALYFKGQWNLPFKAHKTKDQDFYLNSEKTKKVSMMRQTAHFPYYQDQAAQVLEMGYKNEANDNRNYALMIVLPNEKDGLNQLESTFTLEKFKEWQTHLSYENVALSLPKFKIEQKISLKDSLIKMGLVAPFSDEADFSEMTVGPQLKISDVIHQTYISVDEAGTEAAAATAIVMMMTSCLHTPEFEQPFIADHPFMYVLYEKTTGTILFMGKVVNP